MTDMQVRARGRQNQGLLGVEEQGGREGHGARTGPPEGCHLGWGQHERTALTVGQLSGDMKETSVRKRLGRVQRQGLTTEPLNLCTRVTQRSLLFLKSSDQKAKAVSCGEVSRSQVGRAGVAGMSHSRNPQKDGGGEVRWGTRNEAHCPRRCDQAAQGPGGGAKFVFCHRTLRVFLRTEEGKGRGRQD